MQTSILISIMAFWVVFNSYGQTQAQSLGGNWAGVLTQDQSEDHFLYQLELKQTSHGFSGTACSTTEDGSVKVCFVLTGVLDGENLILQEVEQTEPLQPKWCLKYLKLTYSEEGNKELLSGNWTADGCRPGKLQLERGGLSSPSVKEEIPFTYLGTWTGHLQQSDRDYGFYYEVILEENGLGRSHIVSEDNGGSAWHNLQWTLDEAAATIVINEQDILEKTDPRWKWCIKSGTLTFARTGMAYRMTGSWAGHLEGYTPERGSCAPGQLFLEKPVLTREVEQKMEQNHIEYHTKNQREVKVDRVIEVRSETIRIKVWDNGIVDGDIVTIFLNGEQLLHNYRVNKRKWALPVKLNETDNFLILHAEDLGDISPNTVAVSIDDGFKEETILISSDLKTSGAIMIRKFRYEGR